MSRVYSNVIQLYVYLFFSRFLSTIGYYAILNIVKLHFPSFMGLGPGCPGEWEFPERRTGGWGAERSRTVTSPKDLDTPFLVGVSTGRCVFT